MEDLYPKNVHDDAWLFDDISILSGTQQSSTSATEYTTDKTGKKKKKKRRSKRMKKFKKFKRQHKKENKKLKRKIKQMKAAKSEWWQDALIRSAPNAVDLLSTIAKCAIQK